MVEPETINWPGVPFISPVDEFAIGLDIGQSVDPSAISVIHHTITALPTWTVDHKAKVHRQDKAEMFACVHLERLPLPNSYPTQVDYVRSVLARPPFDRIRPIFALDETGCGRPIGDLFEKAGLRPERILITGGTEIARGSTINRWHVPKSHLIARLDALMHSGEFKMPGALRDAGTLVGELKDFERKVSDAGRWSWNARSRKHGDLILSISIALFALSNRNVLTQEALRI